MKIKFKNPALKGLYFRYYYFSRTFVPSLAFEVNYEIWIKTRNNIVFSLYDFKLNIEDEIWNHLRRKYEN